MRSRILRPLGYLIDVDGEQVYVFDFHYPRMFDERRKDDEGNIMPVDRKGRYSDEARRSMAMPVDEFKRSIAVEEANGLVNAAMLIGADKLDDQIEEPVQEGDQKPEETLNTGSVCYTRKRQRKAERASVLLGKFVGDRPAGCFFVLRISLVPV